MQGGGTARREVHIPAAPSAEGETIRLPYWRFSGGAMCPAFNCSRLITLTRWYSERTSLLAAASTPASGRAFGLWGGTIGSGDAARVIALARRPKPSRGRTDHPAAASPQREEADAPAPPGVPPLGTGALLALSYSVEPAKLICPVSGLHLYLETVDSAEEILARWRRAAHP